MTEVLYDTPRVGGDTLSFCTKCKMELAHVIVSMVGTRPAKVQCKTCKAEHKYRSAAPVKSVSARLGMTKKGPPKTAVKISELWEKKMQEAKGKPTRAYGVKEAYKAGELIEHTKFGAGVVENAQRGKINVLFRDSLKILIHEMK